ncbi:MAG: PAS domain S-box protein [Ignavibacteriae bacterium]|nr:PAS domain S-box protein [Ignavibacteriota bacterium]
MKSRSTPNHSSENINITELLQKEKLHQAMLDISNVVNTSQQLQQLYTSIFELLKSSLHIKNYYIAFHTPKQNQITFPFSFDERSKEFLSRTSGKYLEEIVLHDATTYVCTQDDFLTFINQGRLIDDTFPMKVWVGIPLVVQQTVVGVLALYDYTNEKLFGKHELELAKYAATQISFALERKLAVMAIQEHELNLLALLENTDDAIWSIDNDYSIVTYNSQAKNIFRKIFNIELKEGLNFRDSTQTEEKMFWEEMYSRSFNNERFSVNRSYLNGEDRLELNISFNPIVNEQKIVAGVSVFVKNITQIKREEELKRERTELILRNQRVLTELAKKEYDSLETALNTIIVRDAQTLGVEQVSIWSFSQDRREIQCEAFVSLTFAKSMKGVKLHSKNYPTYFNALETLYAVVADDARTNSLTSEFTDSYLIPHGITSMMDTPIHLHGKVIGIVCHEHIGPARKWTLEEQEFATSIAELVSIAYETSKRKQAEIALRENEERYRMFILHSTEAIWRYEIEEPVPVTLPVNEQIQMFYKHGYLAECNEAMAKMYGFDNIEDFIGKRLAETLVPEEEQNIVMLRKLIESNYKLEDMETIEYDRNGNIKYFLNNLVGIVENGYLKRAWGTQRDITERKSAENSLMKLGHALRSISECVCITDMDNKIIFVNKAFTKTYEFSEEELLGHDIGQFHYSGNGSGHVQEIYEMTLKGGWQGEVINSKKDGTLFTSFLSTSIIRDEKGVPIALIGVSNNIEERKKSEKLIKESEQRFRVLTETVESAIIIYQNEKYVYANPAAERLLGYSMEELLGMNFWDVVHPDFKELIRQRGLARQRGEKIPPRYEFKILSKNGVERWIDFTAAVINYQGLQAVLGTAFDITERKRAEQLQSAVYRIAQAAEGAPDLKELFKAVHSIVAEVMYAKNFYIALYDDETNTVSFPYYVDEEDEPPQPQQAGRGLTEYVLRTGKSHLSTLEDHENLVQLGEIESIGSLSPIWLGVPLIIGKKTIGIMTVQHYSDPKTYGETERQMLEYVSTQVAKAIEQKKTEDLLRTNERRFRTLIENSSDVVVMLDKQGRILYESPAIFQVLGFTAESRIGKSIFEKINPDDLQDLKRIYQELLEQPHQSASSTFRVSHVNGTWRWIEAIATNFLFDPNIQAIVSNYRDVTERKNAVESLRDSEEKFRSLFESATDAIFTVSLQGIFTSLNPAFEKITGWKCSEWLGKSFNTILHQEDLPLANRLFQETVSEKPHPAYELRIKTKNDDYFVSEITTTPRRQNNQIIGILGIARDITERKKMEEEIRYIQKMESIGILAGGVAHDFNNILAIINAYTGSIKLSENLPTPLLHNIEIIEKTVRRGARVVQQLLTLARKTESFFSIITVDPIIDELSKLLHETFPKTITFQSDIKQKDVSIAADNNQIYQVLLNLCLNARDAMPLGGSLTIATEITSSEIVQELFPEATGERYLKISVADTGTGIDEKTKHRIFDPFFTTKERGQGTGLGLSVVFGIIENHKGFINVETELNKGTTFNIFLPLPEHLPGDDVLASQVETVAKGGNETLLLVEDEVPLLELMSNILEGYGYKIIPAFDGEEAVQIFAERNEEIKLVLTDMGLPKLGGFEAFQQIKGIRSDVKIILASGYLDTKVRAQMIEAGADDFVQKPYDVLEIVTRIREILDRR